MKAAEAARIKVGEVVEVNTVGNEIGERGKIVSLDEYGLALSMPDNTVAPFAYVPWTTVTGVYWLEKRPK